MQIRKLVPIRALVAAINLVRSLGGFREAFRIGVALVKQERASGLKRIFSIVHLVMTQRATYSNHDFKAWFEKIGGNFSGRTVLRNGPLISVLLPVYNPPLDFLKAAVESVRLQTYEIWELCIADDCSTDEDVLKYLSHISGVDDRIKVKFRSENGHISEATNTALGLSSGEFVAFLDHDDTLPPYALNSVAHAILSKPLVKFFYSDEAHIDPQGKILGGHVKGGLNRELALAYNYFCHLSIYSADLLRELGGLRVGFEGAQDYDLSLRALDELEDHQIMHIPEVLYFWRVFPGSTSQDISAKPYARAAGIKAVESHLLRKGKVGTVSEAPRLSTANRVQFQILEPTPKISILIPTRDNGTVLMTCVKSINSKTEFRNFDIIIIDNGSKNPLTLDILAKLHLIENVQVIRIDEPFNYSRLNNRAAEIASGEYLLLLNDDTEVITPNWLGEMLSFCQFNEIGAVGARLWYENNTLQHGGVILGIGAVAGHSHRHMPKSSLGYMGRAVLHQNYSAVTGACLMVKKSHYNLVGGLTEELSVGYNDVDFCLKLHSQGLRNVWTPYAELMHYESLTRGLDTTPQKVERALAETEYMIKKWGPLLRSDPFYSPNFSRAHEDFSLAW